MTDAPAPRIDITPTWARLNDGLIRLVDYIPDDQINWSPKPELWNFRGILLHIASARDNWLSRTVQDGVNAPDVWRTVQTKAEIQGAFRRTWDRLEAFLADRGKLDEEYNDDDGDWHRVVTGHWIAFHLLEHDVHHRADILHYLALLGIETPDVGTP
ncbi:MAG TPA: DinB family protein [Dehalococcoidia bacterium]|nr:DinB family protein [Dehalococcoidia bacterium]